MIEAVTWKSYLKFSTDRYISRFLLVSLNIDAILREATIHRRRQKLSAMTNGLGLGGAYGATLDRIKGQGEEKSRLGMAALMSPSLNSDNLPSIGTLLVCCQGLVAVDKEASKVRLVHFTLQEYLRTHPEPFGTAHSTMAEICLSYLNSQQVRVLSASSFPDLQDTLSRIFVSVLGDPRKTGPFKLREITCVRAI